MIPDVLRRLLEATGPSGAEGPIAAVFREACAPWAATVEHDSTGSSVARVAGTGSAPSVAFVGHYDEIGFLIHHIDDDGFCWYSHIGGQDPTIAVGQRVRISTRDGDLPGVIGRVPIHVLDADKRKQAPELKELCIDIGARDGDDARSRVRLGDTARFDAEPVLLPTGRVISRAIDNRLGTYIAYETARRVAEAGGAAGEVIAIANSQEEVDLVGAESTAYSVRPDIAIIIDGKWATDQPGIDERQHGRHGLGSGPIISRGSTLHPALFELLHEAAEAEDIPFTVDAIARGTGTDADAYIRARGGIPSAVVGYPMRYLHQPVEMIDLDDVEATVRLLVAFAQRLPADLDLRR
jgi:putative aminopeptidase FrvX